MLTKALKLRSSLVLLVTAAILLQPAGANSSTTAYVCYDESLDCTSDSECVECLSDYLDDVDGWTECVENFEYGGTYDICLVYSVTVCCLDAFSANDCMGNSAFVGYYTCLADYSSEYYGGDVECSLSLTCDYGDGGGVVDEEATGSDITTETDDGAVGNDDARATDDGGVGNSIATEDDDDAVATDDEADSSANTSGTSGAGSSSPSAMLTYALGLAFLSASRFIGVLL